jgi:ABC-type uncharacterized transport system auxiliary subunit
MKSRIARTALIALATTVSCGGKVPETRYYQFAAPVAKSQPGELVIVLEPLETDSGYDDDRIVYRSTPYRLDYYQYHRWSAPPGVMVGNFLKQALERSGAFRAVAREVTDRTPIVLRGRVLALEEVDKSKTSWLGRIVIELTLSDSRRGEALWSEQFEETEPLRLQTPEGLAQALSTAMMRIADRATPVIAERVGRQARLHASEPRLARQSE